MALSTFFPVFLSVLLERAAAASFAEREFGGASGSAAAWETYAPGTEEVPRVASGAEIQAKVANAIGAAAALRSHSKSVRRSMKILASNGAKSHMVQKAMDTIIDTISLKSSPEAAAKSGCLLTQQEFALLAGHNDSLEDAETLFSNPTPQTFSPSGVSLFQGDILVNDARNLDDAHTRNSGHGKIWDNGMLRYCFAPKVKKRALEGFKRAVDVIKKAAPGCVHFQEIGLEKGNSVDGNWSCSGARAGIPSVVITSADTGCFSPVGQSEWHRKRGISQPLNLQVPGCESTGIVLHEIMHALGFYHEMNRVDRSGSILINMSNIKKGKETNFRTLPGTSSASGFDYLSIMTIGPFDFAHNPQIPVCRINGPNPSKASLGQRMGLSDRDIDKVWRVYKSSSNACLATARRTMPCQDSPAAWKDHNNNTCDDYVKSITDCSDGWTSSLHCCKCGGGIRKVFYVPKQTTQQAHAFAKKSQELLIEATSALEHGELRKAGDLAKQMKATQEEAEKLRKDATKRTGAVSVDSAKRTILELMNRAAAQLYEGSVVASRALTAEAEAYGKELGQRKLL